MKIASNTFKFRQGRQNQSWTYKKLKAMLYSNFATEAVQYSIESEAKAIALYVKEMEQEGITV